MGDSRKTQSVRIEDFKARVNDVLAGYSFRVVGEAKLYFIDEVGSKELVSLEDDFDGRGITTKFERKEFAQVVNVLNGSDAAISYSVGLRGKHRQITEQAKVDKYLEGEFAVWKNVVLKKAREIIATHSPDDQTVARINREVNNEIEVAQGELAYILSNRDTLEIKIAGFTHQKVYPYIQYSIELDGKKKLQNKHLSIVAPNVLYYCPAPYRSDMKIDEFIKSAKNAFGDVYYMQKGDDSE